MPKKKLTADVVRELAELIEDRGVVKLIIRPRLAGKNKGELFAEWMTGTDSDYVPDHLNLKLVETLQDIADRLDNKEKIDVQIIKDSENQFISYTRSE